MPGFPLPIFFMSKFESFGVAPTSPTEQECAVSGQRDVFVGRKAPYQVLTKGAVIGRNSFFFVKGRRLGRNGRHFLSEWRHNWRKGRLKITGLKVAVSAQRDACRGRSPICDPSRFATSPFTGKLVRDKGPNHSPNSWAYPFCQT